MSWLRIVVLSFALSGVAYAQAPVVKVQPAPVVKVQPAPAPAPVPVVVKPASQPVVVPGEVKPVTTSEEAVKAAGDFVGAIKAHRWWFAAAVGIFVLMFVLGLFKVWEKIGTTWAWIAVGALSIAAGVFGAFDAKGFNWSVFFGYITAGPTIAWLRDLVKDVILKPKTPA
jgi:hypothetical protein